MRGRLGFLVCGLLSVALWGCGDDCTPNQSLECACEDGSTGAQRCNADGELEACVCRPPQGDAGVECVEHAECDDGLFCNGTEQCDDGTCRRGTRIDCADDVACTIDACNELTHQCANTPPDNDGDGHFDLTCRDEDDEPLGDDCDDDDAARYPGNTEVCDAADVDEDCDATTFGAVDADADGFPDAACCNGDVCGDDCNDTQASIHPTASEVCDGVDNNCDGVVDEELLVDAWRDRDGDKYGDADTLARACPGQVGFAFEAGDCDDDDRSRHPGQVEVCDEQDNNCDAEQLADEGAVDAPWYADADGDGFGDPTDFVISCAPVAGRVLIGTDCDDDNAANNPSTPERCDGVDNNCDGLVNFRISGNDFEDDDGDGVADAACGGDDCDDNNPTVLSSDSPELCDNRDNDCDGYIDEGVARSIFYRDADGDTYGSALSGSISACDLPMGYVARAGDCDDSAIDVSPNAAEVCDDNVDNDCNGAIDELLECSACTCALNNAVASCSNDVCALESCTVGYGNCDFTSNNGCEVNLRTSSNCGVCGRVCGANASCVTSGNEASCQCDANYVGNGTTCASAIDPLACGLTAKVCASGACVAGDCVRRVFVSAQPYAVDLGGRSAYDTVCQTLANGRNLGGTWRAWLSDDSGSPSTLFTRSLAPYRLLNGATIANNWTDLTDGSNSLAINRNENNADMSSYTVTTNTTVTGTRAAANVCGNFTQSGNGVGLVLKGYTNSNAASWTAYASYGCTGMGPIYCFEQ